MNYILSLIFYTRCDLNPLYFLIGADDNKTKFIVQTGYCLISLLSYAALNSIFLKCISEVLFEFLSLEYITYLSKGKMDVV